MDFQTCWDDELKEFHGLCTRIGLNKGLWEHGDERLRCVLDSGLEPTTDVEKLDPLNLRGIWYACIVFIVAYEAELQAGEDFTGAPVEFEKILDCAKVSAKELRGNVKLVLEVCASSKLHDDTGATSYFGSVELHDSDRALLDSLECSQLARVTTSMLFEKFHYLWESSRNFCNFDAAVSSKADRAFGTLWLIYIICRRSLHLNEGGEGNESDECVDIAMSYRLLASLVYLGRNTFLSNLRENENTQLQETSDFQDDPTDKKRKRLRSATTNQQKKVRMLEEDDTGLGRFFVFAKISREDANESIESIQNTIAVFVKDDPKYFSITNPCDIWTPTGLTCPNIRDSLLRFYGKRFVRSVTHVDERSVLLNKNVQIACTPMKEPSANGTPPRPPVRKQVMGDRALTEAAGSGVKKDLFSKVAFRDDVRPSPTRAGTSIPKFSTCASPIRPPRSSVNGRRTPSYAAVNTPVSLSIDASNWLSRELCGAPNAPSEALLRVFKDCPVNPVDEIKNRLEAMSAQLKAGHAESRSSAIGKELFRRHGSCNSISSATSGTPSGLDKHLVSASKLYYRSLESIVRGESSRLGDQGSDKCLDKLLHNDMFHKALFACCLEATFRSKSVFRLMYPKLTRYLNIPAFEIFKVIGSFIHYVPTLPYMVRQHMLHVETDIVEESVWKDGSPIYKLLELRKNEGDGVETNCLEQFLPKLLKIAHERMKHLCTQLGILTDNNTPNVVYKDLWDVFRISINNFSELLQNRHLDLVILCTIYGVCRVKRIQPEVSFKRLVLSYKRSRSEDRDSYQALLKKITRSQHGYERVIQDIRLDAEGVTAKVGKGNLIDYYNMVYIPKMKETILNLRTKATSDSHTPIRSGTFPSPSRTSGGIQQAPRTPGSPTRTSPKQVSESSSVHMTPRTRVLYAFGESPAADMQSIRHAMQTRRRLRIRRNPIDDTDQGATRTANRSSSRIQNMVTRSRMMKMKQAPPQK
mmetsp:Transcript_16096/g.27721  ORF Transcript_16096/g.27721 Transcript_16096/m.27721 type:complete len:980 (+) Transcript_16096:422-3361(+)|eukprot:CAMPEP_0203758542 /NCGR_PEP_ID=MMETSP0098-20131031/11392_1 /ASSEMBLY_ACC=CAM_ASM_000208 /TAXON_ID=96639 /ORGANISM=" , Strain NY0313808BC1" /LENGTH=979 /DNA_ID=CAMNT_0050651037 /DNA_START=395 /DNA_END=3331 /DNA_ORIENTATION=-